MRIFLAGATGVIGVRLLRLMLSEGHEVAAMTRSSEKVGQLHAAGALPVLCNVLDGAAVVAAVKALRPDVLVHQVTDLPDEIDRISRFALANARIRSIGTRNLIAAAQAVGATGFVAQSLAWTDGPMLQAHEHAVLTAGGTVLRYGRFYGPGTYYEHALPASPRIHIDAAALLTLPFLQGPPGITPIFDPIVEADPNADLIDSRRAWQQRRVTPRSDRYIGR